VIEATPYARRRLAARAGLCATRAGLCAALVLLGACSHTQALKPSNWHAHWPWQHAPEPPPPTVTELVAEGSASGAAPALVQTWDRNTLRVSLTTVAGEGEFVLRPVAGHGWPIRLEFAVLPGSFAHLEVRGDQRVILAVPETGGETVLAVPAGIYASATTALTLHYGP
jgi:hypothetical protein